MDSLHFEKGSMKNQPIVIASVSEAISGWRRVCKLASSSYFKPGTLLTLLPRTILNLVMLAWLVIVFYNANETTTPHLLIPSQRGKGNSFFWAARGQTPLLALCFPISPNPQVIDCSKPCARFVPMGCSLLEVRRGLKYFLEAAGRKYSALANVCSQNVKALRGEGGIILLRKSLGAAQGGTK